MSLRDFALMVGVCLIWAVNTVLSRIVVADYEVEPLFYAAVRFALVLMMTAPWLFPIPRPVWRLIAVGLLMGGGTFALFFMGLQTATPSEAAVIGQLGLPMTTLLSVFMLSERIHWRRGLGIALAFAGVMTVMWNPQGLHASVGLYLCAAGAFCGSLGSVMMKQMDGVKPLQFQAWVGLSSLVPLIALTALFEPDGYRSAVGAGWVFPAAVIFSAVVVSVIGHTTYYFLIQRYEANLIAPLTLMAPLATIGFGVVLTQDPFGPRMALGTLICLTGVLIIALRREHMAPLKLWLGNRA